MSKNPALGFQSGYSAFMSGRHKSSAKQILSDEFRELWLKGWNKALDDSTDEDQQMYRAIRSVKSHFVNSGKAYVFVTSNFKIIIKSKNKRHVDRWLTKKGAYFVGCYAPPMDVQDLIDDIKATISEIKEAKK